MDTGVTEDTAMVDRGPVPTGMCSMDPMQEERVRTQAVLTMPPWE